MKTYFAIIILKLNDVYTNGCLKYDISYYYYFVNNVYLIRLFKPNHCVQKKNGTNYNNL